MAMPLRPERTPERTRRPLESVTLWLMAMPLRPDFTWVFTFMGSLLEEDSSEPPFQCDSYLHGADPEENTKRKKWVWLLPDDGSIEAPKVRHDLELRATPPGGAEARGWHVDAKELHCRLHSISKPRKVSR
jgi:hypothetical protein